MSEKLKVFEKLEDLSALVPTAFYWTDTEAKIVGFNQYCLTIIGAPSSQSYIGKGPFDMYPKDIADIVYANTKQVVQAGKTLSFEESVADITTGKIRYYTVTRSPLFEDGKVIGTVGVTVEITAEKEAERLLIEKNKSEAERLILRAQIEKDRAESENQILILHMENESQKVQLEQAEKIRKITGQVVHDMGSPIQCLRTMTENVKNISEFDRRVIRNAADRINDILNNLTAKYGATGKIVNESPNVLAPEIISCLVDGILSEKRVQFAAYDIAFELHIANDAHGIFAKVNSERFKRIISNVINNAVEAIAKKQQQHGCINIHVYKAANLLNIQIKDNGCGIPRTILEKLGVDQITTKTEGEHGIGLSSAIAQLKEWGGSYNIDSVEEVGVTFTIGLPIASVPGWFLDNLYFKPHAQIVILDDDESIHNVWEMRFKDYLDKVTLHHFTNSQMLFKCLANLQTYDNIVYLIDYELIGSEGSGVDVIEKLPTTRNAFLVTSRYEDKNVRDKCEKLKVKILPKNFAPYIPIQMTEALLEKSANMGDTPDYVIIDDQECITMMWQAMAETHGVHLAAFNSIKDFEKYKDKFNKATPIYIDRNLEGEDGLEYSKVLANEGFTNIYLATADAKNAITIDTPWLKGIVQKKPPFV